MGLEAGFREKGGDLRGLLAIIEEMFNISQGEVLRHPNDPDAHILYAKVLVVSHYSLRNDAIPDAIEVLQYAQTIAPHFQPIMQMRVLLAEYIKDKAEIRRGREDLKRIERILGTEE